MKVNLVVDGGQRVERRKKFIKHSPWVKQEGELAEEAQEDEEEEEEEEDEDNS